MAATGRLYMGFSRTKAGRQTHLEMPEALVSDNTRAEVYKHTKETDAVRSSVTCSVPLCPSAVFHLPGDQAPLYTKAGSVSLYAKVGSADMRGHSCAHLTEVWGAPAAER